MRVLLADSNQSVLEIAQSFLWDRGYEAEMAADGLECMAILEEFLPNVLVLDYDLLWGGGEGVLELMTENACLSGIAIVLTGNGNGCLSKPYRLGELLTHIQAASRLSRSVDCYQEGV